MSVNSEIERIRGNIAASYTAAEEKGAMMPTEQDSDNLAATVASIKTGGAVESVNGQTGVVVLDADDVGAAPMYYYGTEDIEAGSPSTDPEGSLRFVIE